MISDIIPSQSEMQLWEQPIQFGLSSPTDNTTEGVIVTLMPA